MKSLNNFILVTFILIGFVIGSTFSLMLVVNSLKSIDRPFTFEIMLAVINLLGGLLGAIIAFIVARSQITHDKTIRNETQKTVNLNMIRALINELEHNSKIYEVLKNKNTNFEQYILSLENEVWRNIKYDANNFIPPELYKVLDNISREIEDFKASILPEYKKTAEIDFDKRYKIINQLIIDLSSTEANN